MGIQTPAENLASMYLLAAALHALQNPGAAALLPWDQTAREACAA